MKLTKPANFSFQESLWFLDRNYDDCLHIVTENKVTKAIRIDNDAVLFEVTDDQEYLRIKLLSGNVREEKLIKYLTQWFDLERDISPFYQLRHPVIEQLTGQYHGLRLIAIPDLFEALCWSIIGQQINLTFAYKLKRRLVEKYGEYISSKNEKHYLFPKPEQLLKVTIEDLKGIQFSRQKAMYIIELAHQFDQGLISKPSIEAAGDTPKMIKELMKIKGIGEWTANYAIMKSFKRMDCITYGDIGLLNGMKMLFDLDNKPTRDQVDDFFNHAPFWESYLVFYIWRSLS